MLLFLIFAYYLLYLLLLLPYLFSCSAWLLSKFIELLLCLSLWFDVQVTTRSKTKQKLQSQSNGKLSYRNPIGNYLQNDASAKGACRSRNCLFVSLSVSFTFFFYILSLLFLIKIFQLLSVERNALRSWRVALPNWSATKASWRFLERSSYLLARSARASAELRAASAAASLPLPLFRCLCCLSHLWLWEWRMLWETLESKYEFIVVCGSFSCDILHLCAFCVTVCEYEWQSLCSQYTQHKYVRRN